MIKNIILNTLFLLLLTGCGPSGPSEFSSETKDVVVSVSTESNFTSVTVERGAVFMATVKDAEGQVATNNDLGMSNIYTFKASPKRPISVTSGYVDVNNNGLLDANDTKLDINLSSYVSVVSPLTTLIGDYENNATVLNSLVQNYEINISQIIGSVPSKTSKDAIILSNAIYKSLKLGFEYNSTNFRQSIVDVNTTYNQSFNSLTSLSELASSLENQVFIDLGVSRLGSAELSQINSELSSNYYVTTLELNNFIFTKSKVTTDDVSDIWNITFDIPKNQNIENFDIGIHMVKKSSQTIGNIVVKGITIQNNKIESITSVVVFGEKASGSTGSQGYNSAHNITKKSVLLIQGKLVFNLGYIISNQTIVSSSSFTNAAEYSINLYASKLDINGSTLESNATLRTSFFDYFTFENPSQEINGTLLIGN